MHAIAAFVGDSIAQVLTHIIRKALRPVGRHGDGGVRVQIEERLGSVKETIAVVVRERTDFTTHVAARDVAADQRNRTRQMADLNLHRVLCARGGRRVEGEWE